MPAVTPSFVFDLESRMRHIQVNDMARLMAAENQWWDTCTKRLTTGARKDVITWILETASLQDIGKMGGNLSFDDMTVLEYEYEVGAAGKGLKLRRQQFEDLDGNGVNLAMAWVRQMTAQAAYWPQKQITALLKAGETGTAYDSSNFFSATHPLNPFDSSVGTYSNLFTSVPIDAGVSADVALTNLSTVFANIASIKLPNGQDPRFLRPGAIICSPKLFPRLAQLTNAKFIASVAGAAVGGGSSDVEALISALGYGTPTMAAEFAGWESDTTYFVVAKQEDADQLGSLVYVDREPFSIRYYTGRGGGTGTDAVLDRADTLEWHQTGRNTAQYGHPYLLFKCKA
jgi:hypothetical protein